MSKTGPIIKKKSLNTMELAIKFDEYYKALSNNDPLVIRLDKQFTPDQARVLKGYIKAKDQFLEKRKTKQSGGSQNPDLEPKSKKFFQKKKNSNRV